MKFQEYILVHLSLVLLCAKLALLWVLANYTYPSDPAVGTGEKSRRSLAPRGWLAVVVARSLALACLTVWISGWSYSLGAFALALAILQPLVRLRIPSRYLADYEIASNLIFVLGVVSLAILKTDQAAIPASQIPASRQTAAACIVIAIAIFIMRGGATIVRGILDKGRISPERSGPTAVGGGKPPDSGVSNHGRIIGIIERLMLMTFVALKAYDALAFLLTAKGLFRSKDLDDASFAEYFLVGTLASSMIAIAAGLAVQSVVMLLW